MRVQIDNTKLSDSPYSDKNKSLFISPHKDTLDLIQDITYGAATCYFISGYRGAGKSSFINKVKLAIEKSESDKKEKESKENALNTKKIEEVVFVEVNFSRYHSQTILLRKLIRGLYFKLRDLDSFKKTKDAEKDAPVEKKFAHGLEEIFDKTFYDTSHHTAKSNKKQVVTIYDIDIKEFLKLILLPVALFVLFTISSFYKSPVLIVVGKILAALISGIVSIKGIVNIKRKITKSSVEQQDFNRKSMYDDEIADYHFGRILKDLKDKGYRIIFILDELDKVEDEDINKLLKEIKPYLVSGEASFIAVAGQKLYYQYEQAKSKDDDILSSVFSRFIHIPLLSREEFRTLFDKLVIITEKPTLDEKKQLNKYIDYLIFESKRVPRKFISIIRHNLTWVNNQSFLEINKTDKELDTYSKILDTLVRLDEEINAEGEFEDARHDYLIMQLFIKSSQIISNKRLDFTLSDLQQNEGEKEDKVYNDFHNQMKPYFDCYIEKLVDEFVEDKIIFHKGDKYSLNPDVIQKTELSAAPQKNIFDELSQFRSIIRIVYSNLEYPDSNSIAHLNLMDIISKLDKYKAISAPWKNNAEVSTIMNDMSSLRTEKTETIRNVQKILDANKINLRVITAKLLDFYGIRTATKYFSDFNFNTIDKTKLLLNEFDFELEPQNKHYPTILFDFKYLRNAILPTKNNLLKAFKSFSLYNANGIENYYYYMVVFTNREIGEFKRVKFEFSQILKDIPEYAAFKGRINFLPVSTESIHLITEGFKEFKDLFIQEDIKFNFSGQTPPQSLPHLNDHVYDRVFDVKQDDFEIKIKPANSLYWRFGLRFYKTDDFPPINEGRYKDKDISTIEICVGDLGNNNIWINQNIVSLHSENMGDITTQNGKRFLETYNAEEITLIAQSRNNGSQMYFAVKISDEIIEQKLFQLNNKNFCQLSAWADFTGFVLITEIKVIHKEGEKLLHLNV